MEITAPVGTPIIAYCQYEYSEPLDMLVFEDNVPRNDSSETYLDYGKAFKTWKVFVECRPIVITCALRNRQMVIVGQVSGIVYPGLMFYNNYMFNVFLYVSNISRVLKHIVYVKCSIQNIITFFYKKKNIIIAFVISFLLI